MGCTESIGNAIDDAFDVLVDLGQPESQHAKAQLAQPAISPRVIDKLIAVVVAIDFDHQPRLQAGEVREVGPDRNLASELVSPCPQALTKGLRRQARPLSPPPNLPPQRGGRT